MNFLLKRCGLFCLSLMLCLSANFVYGETMYVSDILKLTLRTGPSTENKILAVIESGQMLNIIKFGDEWSQAQLPDGKEGWVLTRYLTPEETNNIKLERLESKHKNLMIQAAALLEENNKLKAESQKLRSDFEVNKKQMTRAQTDYETLKTEVAEFLTLKSKYETAASQLAEQTARADKLEDQLTKQELSYHIKWFLAGSGVLVVGFLIGFSTKRQRRRPALS